MLDMLLDFSTMNINLKVIIGNLLKFIKKYY